MSAMPCKKNPSTDRECMKAPGHKGVHVSTYPGGRDEWGRDAGELVELLGLESFGPWGEGFKPSAEPMDEGLVADCVDEIRGGSPVVCLLVQHAGQVLKAARGEGLDVDLYRIPKSAVPKGARPDGHGALTVVVEVSWMDVYAVSHDAGMTHPTPVEAT